jgi:hypothetical protein
MAEQSASTLCPDCGRPIHLGSPVVICGECGMLHHRECWLANRGCGASGSKRITAEDEATEQELGLLRLALKRSYPDGRCAVVTPLSVTYPYWGSYHRDDSEIEERKRYITDRLLASTVRTQRYSSWDDYARYHVETEERLLSTKEWLQIRQAEVAELVDRLFERNKKPVRLSIESRPKDGYVVDDGRYQKYFEDGGGGWDEFYKEDPQPWGMTEVMLPVYDQETGLVLVYQGTRSGPLSGSGNVTLYRYEKGALEELDQVEVWAS